MKIVFLGTRGYIEARSKRHRMHTSTLLIYRQKKILIDCGEDWIGKIPKVDAILLTHAHPDHAFGLKKGAPCPVWATQETFDYIDRFPIDQHILPIRKKTRICGITFEAFPLWHSIRCPAVGYRITLGSVRFFYVPDVAYIPHIDEAFKNIQFYIGDGATIHRKMIRKHKITGEIFGHANIGQQLTWCYKQKVAKMIITHCGSALVTHEAQAKIEIAKLALKKKVQVEIAYDGLEIRL